MNKREKEKKNRTTRNGRKTHKIIARTHQEYIFNFIIFLMRASRSKHATAGLLWFYCRHKLSTAPGPLPLRPTGFILNQENGVGFYRKRMKKKKKKRY